MNKTEYWKRRKKGERGQEPAPNPRFWPKGDKVAYTKRDGEEADYPNDEGQNLIRTNKGLQRANRKQERRSWKNRKATKKGYKEHVVNPARQPESKYPASWTNHDKMIHRKKMREQRRAERDKEASDNN